MSDPCLPASCVFCLCVCVCVCARARACVRACERARVHACLPASQPACQPASQPACLPASLLACLPASLPAYQKEYRGERVPHVKVHCVSTEPGQNLLQSRGLLCHHRLAVPETFDHFRGPGPELTLRPGSHCHRATRCSCLAWGGTHRAFGDSSKFGSDSLFPFCCIRAFSNSSQRRLGKDHDLPPSLSASSRQVHGPVPFAASGRFLLHPTRMPVARRRVWSPWRLVPASYPWMATAASVGSVGYKEIARRRECTLLWQIAFRRGAGHMRLRLTLGLFKMFRPTARDFLCV